MCFWQAQTALHTTAGCLRESNFRGFWNNGNHTYPGKAHLPGGRGGKGQNKTLKYDFDCLPYGQKKDCFIVLLWTDPPKQGNWTKTVLFRPQSTLTKPELSAFAGNVSGKESVSSFRSDSADRKENRFTDWPKRCRFSMEKDAESWLRTVYPGGGFLPLGQTSFFFWCIPKTIFMQKISGFQHKCCWQRINIMVW